MAFFQKAYIRSPQNSSGLSAKFCHHEASDPDWTQLLAKLILIKLPGGRDADRNF